jgi:signal transduction histidine kinase
MKHDHAFSAYELRMGVFYGAIVLGVFGLLDPFMMPVNYHLAWIIRYAVFIPMLAIFFGFTFLPAFRRMSRLPSFILLIIGQMLILLLIAVSSKEEPAYHHYYIGLLVIMLWTGFVSRFGMKENLILFVFTLIMLNVVYGIIHQGFKAEYFPTERKIIIGANVVLFFTGGIIINGTWQLEKFKKRWRAEMLNTENARRTAEKSDRLKTAFLANMSHEVRTPLNGMIGFADMLKDPALPQYKREMYLGFIKSGSLRLLQIINDIIDISELESNQVAISPSKFKVGKAIFEKVDEYQQNLEQYTKKPLKIRMKIPPETVNLFIHADYEHFSKVLDHLILNAFKYTNQGYIEVGVAPYNRQSDESLCFYVADTGIGIDPQYHAFIFEPFNKVKDLQMRSGNGLGLSITKKLVEMMGGKIWVESQINKGSTFFFSLPIKELD